MDHDEREMTSPEQAATEHERDASELTAKELEDVAGGLTAINFSSTNIDVVVQVVMSEAAKDQQNDLRDLLADMNRK